jgi:hypothetical protein
MIVPTLEVTSIVRRIYTKLDQEFITILNLVVCHWYEHIDTLKRR